MKLMKWGVIALLVTLLSCEKEEVKPDEKVTLPKVYLEHSAEKSTTTITVSYSINSDGGASIIDKGICWSLSSNPVIDDTSSIKVVRSEEGRVLLSGLQPETQYYIRAFAVNSAGVGYSDELVVTTNNAEDVIITSVGELTVTNAEDNTVGGVVTSMSGMFEAIYHLADNDSVKSKGVCWSSETNFDLKSSNVAYHTTLSMPMSVTVDSFPLNQLLYIKPFIETQNEIIYGRAVTFDTRPVIVIDTTINPDGDSIIIPYDPYDYVVAHKPNIYLYPEETTQLQVNLSFPQGGSVVESIPDYGTGWDVSVEPSGLIDGSYTYLFYESAQPNMWQKSEGWILEQSELQTFFETNMKECGFEGQEIVDFTDYWMPLFTDKQYYVVYPQDADVINTLITLDISEQPDNLLRLFYVVHGYDTYPRMHLTTPTVDKSFKREGYFVTEWGVVL